jgi:hypothetical protein
LIGYDFVLYVALEHGIVAYPHMYRITVVKRIVEIDVG